MWEHPLTQTQISTVEGFWNTAHNGVQQLIETRVEPNTCTNSVRIIAPQVKTLACGEIGNGALASTDDILRVISDVTFETGKFNNSEAT